MINKHALHLSALCSLALALAGCGSGSGAPCQGASIVCGDACVEVSADNSNCGACGNACAPGLLCAGGACVLSCQAGLVACGGGCIDPSSSASHCGASAGCTGADAGVVCGPGEICASGACVSSCQEGLVSCGGLCVDPQSDDQHCGASAGCTGASAGQVCPSGESCSSGRCALSCQQGLLDCDGTCIDPETDREHCGAGPGCSGAAAGSLCADGQLCAGGVCALSCQQGLIDCGGACIDPLSDLNHCGASAGCSGADAGSVCASGEVCSGGSCATTCAANLLPCNGACIDPSSDRGYCGASGCSGADAGTVCGPGELCTGGSCVLSCGSGLINCGGACVDPGSNPDFCGASGSCTGALAGSACPAGEACVGGACAQLCPSTPLDLATPFGTTRPAVYTAVSQPSGYQPSGYWNGQQAPLPTNMWWQNLVVGSGQSRIDFVPYQIHALPTGVAVSRAALQVSTTDAYVPDVQQILFGAAQGFSNSPKVIGYDAFSVTLRYSGGAGTLSFPLVQGMPYVSADYNSLTPKLLPGQFSFTSVNGSASGSASGARFTLSLSDGSNWILYASSTITLSWSSGAITGSNAYTGTLRIAGLTSQAGAAAVLDAHQGAVPRGGSYTVSIACGVATLAFSFVNTGPGPLLMMAMPHHLTHLVNPTLPGLSFTTLSGNIQGVEGSTWTQSITLPGIGFTAPRPLAQNDVAAIQAALSADTIAAVDNSTTHFIDSAAPLGADPYFNGKAMAKLARLSLIADELGDEADGETLRGILEPLSAAWFNATNPDSLVYDTTWGGIVTTNGLNNPSADFGQGHYNDHHFHYGYHLYAAAVLTKDDPAYAVIHHDAIYGMVRDIANPSNGDPQFPVLRMFDIFRSHSWASGLTEWPDGVNQESTSEAVNAWYALRLLGLATNDVRLADLGSLLLAMEIDAARTYWQEPITAQIYSTPFNQNRCVGRLFNSEATFDTWFGTNPEYVYGIQMIPFTPISEQLIAPSWISDAWPAKMSPLATQLSSNTGDGWLGFLYMAHAQIDPADAWTECNTLTGYDDGNSKTNTLWWAASRP